MEVMENRDLFDKVRLYVGKKATYYMPKYFKMKKKGKKLSWNWAAFLFQSYWLIYRRMYLGAILFWLIDQLIRCGSMFIWVKTGLIDMNLVASVLLGGANDEMASSVNVDKLLIASVIALISILIYYVLFGMFANYIYLMRCERLAQKEDSLSSSQAHRQMVKKGGVNGFAVAVVIFLPYVLVYLIGFLIGLIA